MLAPLAPFAPSVCAAFRPLHSRGLIVLVAVGDLGPWDDTVRPVSNKVVDPDQQEPVHQEAA